MSRAVKNCLKTSTEYSLRHLTNNRISVRNLCRDFRRKIPVPNICKQNLLHMFLYTACYPSKKFKHWVLLWALVYLHIYIYIYEYIYIYKTYIYVTDFFEISRISRFMKGLKSASEVGKSILGHF